LRASAGIPQQNGQEVADVDTQFECWAANERLDFSSLNAISRFAAFGLIDLSGVRPRDQTAGTSAV